MTDCIIPDGVTSIWDGAFYGCSRLTGITIPTSVTSIGNGAFYDCEKLTGITIPSRFTDDDIRKWYLPENCKIIRK